METDRIHVPEMLRLLELNERSFPFRKNVIELSFVLPDVIFKRWNFSNISVY